MIAFSPVVRYVGAVTARLSPKHVVFAELARTGLLYVPLPEDRTHELPSQKGGYIVTGVTTTSQLKQ